MRDHGVRLEHRPEGNDRLDGVVGEDDHPVAALHAACDQVMRERVRARLELAIGDALLAAHQRDLVRQGGGPSG